MATEIRVLKNVDDTVFYPKTHVTAVEGLDSATTTTSGLINARQRQNEIKWNRS